MYYMSDNLKAEDLMKVYDVRKHPKFMNGQWTKEQCINEFLKTFEVGGDVDGKVPTSHFHVQFVNHGVQATLCFSYFRFAHAPDETLDSKYLIVFGYFCFA